MRELELYIKVIFLNFYGSRIIFLIFENFKKVPQHLYLQSDSCKSYFFLLKKSEQYFCNKSYSLLFGINEQLKRISSNYFSNENGKLPLSVCYLNGMVTGFLVSFIAHPFDLIRTKLNVLQFLNFFYIFFIFEKK